MVSCSDRGDDVAQSVPSTHEREQHRQKEEKNITPFAVQQCMKTISETRPYRHFSKIKEQRLVITALIFYMRPISSRIYTRDKTVPYICVHWFWGESATTPLFFTSCVSESGSMTTTYLNTTPTTPL